MNSNIYNSKYCKWTNSKQTIFVYKNKSKYTIDKDTKENIIMNVKALFLHNIGGFCVFGTDNILISSFISLATVGIYSNYTMIIGQLIFFIGANFKWNWC